MSTTYHPQTNGLSERTNKTLGQCIRYHVNRKQKGWVKALPQVQFAIMNTVNASMGYSLFQLCMGFSPYVIPPLVHPHDGSCASLDEGAMRALIEHLETAAMDTQDNLLTAKITQAHATNKHCAPDPGFTVGDRVLLATKNRRRNYMQKHDGQVAKFIPRYDGPYTVVETHLELSVYTLDLPNTMNIYPAFHSSLLRKYVPNDASLFPDRELPRPGPIVTDNGAAEWTVERVLDERKCGHGMQYLVR